MFYNFSLEWLTDGEDGIVTVEEIVSARNELEIYPVPASKYIKVKSKDLIHINIYNINAQLIRSLENYNEILTIDISDFAKGTYFIEALDCNRNVKNAKFIVE